MPASSHWPFSVQLCLILANINISIFYHHSWLGSSHIVCLFAVKKVAGHMFAYPKIKHLCKNHSWILSSILILTEFLSSLDKIITVSTFSRLKLKVLCFQSPLEFLGTLSEIVGALTEPSEELACTCCSHVKSHWSNSSFTIRLLDPDRASEGGCDSENVTLQGIRLAGHMVSKPAGGVQLSRGCASLWKNCRKRPPDCTASESREADWLNLLLDLAASRAWTFNCSGGAGKAYACMKLERGNSHEDGGWKLVNSYSMKKVHAPPDNLHFQNSFTALAVDANPLWWVSLSHSESQESGK